jgi:hypothetical protein
MAVWYSLWSFAIFFPFRNVWTKKNLAILLKLRVLYVKKKTEQFEKNRHLFKTATKKSTLNKSYYLHT